MPNKLLIIRLSSFGDIVQCLGVPQIFNSTFPQSEVHWLVRSDFKEILSPHPHIHKIWPLDRKSGLRGLWQMIQDLKAENFSHVYDAHNNLRSHIICFFLKKNQFVRRSKDRIKRFFLFCLRKNYFKSPFVAQDSFISPLKPWGVLTSIPPAPQFFTNADVSVPFKDFIALAPSAAWELKRWPINYWKKLIELLPEKNFIILGGPEDTFCSELVIPGQEGRILNWAGKLSLTESCAVVQKSKLLISNDTGLMHVADQLGTQLISLIGPTAFGYPARSSSQVLEVNLPCKPCSKDGRGNCKNTTYKKCMRDISPDWVNQTVRKILDA